MKRITACLTAVLLCFGIVSFPTFAEETDSGTVYYYSDMSGEGSLNGATTNLHVRTPASFEKDADGTDYIKLETVDGDVKTNYSFLNLPVITNTDDVKPDVVFELRMRNSMNNNSLITTRNNTHAFFLCGANIRRSYYSPEYAEGNIGTYSYNTWNTITVVYRGAEDRREIYLNGVHLADSLPGYATSGGAYNNWYQNGRLDLQLWFYLSATGHYADIDYISVYKLPESIDAAVLNGDATDLNEIYIDFNTPVTFTKEMITLSSGEAVSVELTDKRENIYRVTLSEPLEISTSYELSVDGATDLFGNNLNKTLSFTTRGKVFDGGALSLKTVASEIDSYTEGALFLEGTVKNELAEEKEAAAVLAVYDEEGKMIVPFAEAIDVKTEDDTPVSFPVELPAEGVKATAMVWESTEKPVPIGDIVSYESTKNIYDYKAINSSFEGNAELNLEIIAEEEKEKLKAELTLSGGEREFLTGIIVKDPDGGIRYLGGSLTENGTSVFEIPLDYTKIGKYTVICGVERGGTVSKEIDYYSSAYINEKTEECINSESATSETAADFVELFGEYLGFDTASFSELSDKERSLELFLEQKVLFENGIYNSVEEMKKGFLTAIAMEKLYEGTDADKILKESGIFELPENVSYVLSEVLSSEGMKYISDELKGSDLRLPSEVVAYVRELAVLGGIYKAENYLTVSGILSRFGEELGINTAELEALKSPAAVSRGIMNKSYDSLEDLTAAVNKLITERKRAEATASSKPSGGGGGGGGGAGRININTESPKKEENKEEVKEEKKISFPDVKENDWFYGDVMWAAEKGIFIGTDTGEFLPFMNLTFEHVSIIFGRMGYAPCENKEKRDITRAEFAEYLFRNKVKDGSFTDSKKWIEASGIFKGDINGDMMYDKPFTRAECCTVLRRLENEEK